jgi:hypothetical protein
VQKLARFFSQENPKNKGVEFEKITQEINREFRKETKHSCQKCIKNNSVKYPNIQCSLKIIFREEGIKGFFRGLSMRMTQ